MKRTLFFSVSLYLYAQLLRTNHFPSHTAVRWKDGRTGDASHIFLENDNDSFFTEPSGMKADWSLALYNTNQGNEAIIVLIPDESSNHFTIKCLHLQQ